MRVCGRAVLAVTRDNIELVNELLKNMGVLTLNIHQHRLYITKGGALISAEKGTFLIYDIVGKSDAISFVVK